MLRKLRFARPNPILLKRGTKGLDILRSPMLNRGTAFTHGERDQLGLRGLLPPVVKSLEQQLSRARTMVDAVPHTVDKHAFMTDLQDRNELLFFKLLCSDIERFAPIVYTPTVGLATQNFSSIWRRPRGLFVSARDKGSILQVLHNWREADIAVIVVTDGSRVLGLGDLGINGMQISIGKLALYVAAGGIHPSHTLPIVIDVGTNNPALLEHPDYLGLRQPRITQQEFDELMDEFLWAVKTRWPNALVQFEDFSNNNAYPLLHRYRKMCRVFNDDVQGTGAVVTAGIYSSLRKMGKPLEALKEQRIVCLGGGSAGLGVCFAIFNAMVSLGLSADEAAARFWIVDRDGLITAGRSKLLHGQERFARPSHEAEGKSLLDTINAAQPTVLLGLSGVGGTFTEPMIRSMARFNASPIIFPLSNPTANAECTAEQVHSWSDGRAIVAAGSPFDPVTVGGRVCLTSQSNNMFIYPGVGMGTILCGATRVSVSMFAVAARALAENVDLTTGLVYPRVSTIRDVSARVATAVIEEASRRGLATIKRPPQFEDTLDWVRHSMWSPELSPIVSVGEDAVEQNH
jgi:malate dehydrogenase (oxaloacetate-decarboxylating)(NADP+)